jgi:hypothetical protein
MEYYSATKRKETLEGIVQSERNQSQKDKYYYSADKRHLK